MPQVSEAVEIVGAVGDPEALADVEDVRAEIVKEERLREHVIQGNERNRAKANAALAKLDADSAARSRQVANGGSPPSRNPKADAIRLDNEELLAACMLREYGDGPEDLPAIDARLAVLRERLASLEQTATNHALENLIDDLTAALQVARDLAEPFETTRGNHSGGLANVAIVGDFRPLLRLLHGAEIFSGTPTAAEDLRKIESYRARREGGE